METLNIKIAAGDAFDERSGNIFLVGMMGAGKTTVGRLLAHFSGRHFITQSDILKRTGVGIPVIFEIEGEEGFRKRETDMLARAG